GDVPIDRDRRRCETPYRSAYQRRAPVPAALRERRAQMPHDRKPLPTSQERSRDQRRVVEVHELEALAAKRPAKLVHVARQADELAAEEQPAPSAVRRGPDVREPRDGTGVDDRAG